VPDRSERTQSQVNKMGLPVILSLAGHIAVLTLLILFMTATHPPPQPLEKHGIAVAFAPLVALQATLVPARPIEPLAPPTVASQPPEEAIPPLPAREAPSAAVAQVPVAPPEQTVTVEAPPPPKPAIKPKPKYVVRRQETPQPPPAPPRYMEALPANLAASQYAAPSAAASVPGPDPTVNYGALVRAWFESHKHYPDSARERGEEGNVRLRFRVDRYGRVVDYALVTSTGYADLDQSVEQMMSGARLPPFPAGMTEPDIELSVNIGFSLLR
jgi:periplasmic protein TonB